MKYLEKYDLYIDDDLVVYRYAKRNSYGHAAGQLYRVPLQLDKSGYLQITVHENNRTITVRYHRIIALAFIPNPENKPTVDHINRDKTDNRIENLRWATQMEQEENKDRTEKSRQLHDGCRCKKFDSYGKEIRDDETRTWQRIQYQLTIDRKHEVDNARYYRHHDRRLADVMRRYKENMKTRRRVLFSDGSHHWVGLDDALLLFKIPVSERVYGSHDKTVAAPA